MAQDQKPANTSQQNPEHGNATNPRENDPASRGQKQSGLDLPGNSGKKNPGHANPAHNTPGHIRQNQPGQQDLGHPGQGETQSYPGIKGPKAHELQQDSAIGAEQVKDRGKKIADTAQRKVGNAEDDVLDMPKE